MAEKGQAELAHKGSCCFSLLAESLNNSPYRGEEHHCAALTQATAAGSSRHSISPKSVSLLYPGCDSKTAAAKIIIFQTVHNTSKMDLELASSDAYCESPRSLMFQMFVMSMKPWFCSAFVFTRCCFILGLKIFNQFFPQEDFSMCFFLWQTCNTLLVGIV